jgi:DHA3 family macrolide efflux protein-like MFS transporter
LTTPPSGGPAPSFSRALRNRSFLFLWLSQLISQSGDFVFEVALLWLVLEVTGSVFAVGLVVAVTLIPAVILGPFLGVYIDRWDRRRILIAINGLEGIVVAGLSGLILTHTIDLPLILAVVFVLGAGAQVVRTATNATIPLVVAPEDLPPANSLMTFSGALNQVIGLSIGGVVVALLGVTIPIEYDALSFFLAAGLVALVSQSAGRPKDATRSPQAKFTEEFLEGIRFIRENRFLVELIVLAVFLNFFGNAIGALFAPYSKIVLHGGASTYGFLGATLAIGTIIGAAVVGKLDIRNSSGKFVLAGGAVIGASIAALGLSSTIPVSLVVVLVLGIALSIANIPISVLLQARVPPRLMGRVMAAALSLILVGGPFGALFAGSFAEATSVQTVFIVSGVLFLATILIGGALMKELRAVTY